jgi:type IV secretory pathway VirD2 relaxase
MGFKVMRINAHRPMSGTEDDYRPKLGRIRSLGGRSAKRYLGRLAAVMEKVRPGALAKRSGRSYALSHIGRGAGIGAALSLRAHPFAKFRARRVAVKIRSVRLGETGFAKARAHLRYIERDGAEKDGAPGRLYGHDREAVDGAAFLEEGRADRHQFRVILSPEDAGDLEDLSRFTREVMSAAEKDLGTKLEWVAVNHHDTDHPHVHIVLRGKADDGQNLVIARNYITHGFRKRAEELATLELGPRSDLDIARSRFDEAAKDRFTSLDRELQELASEGVVDLAKPRSVYDRFRLKLLTARLRTLEQMGLATREKDGWRLSPQHEETLRDMGRRGDIIRSMGQALGRDVLPAAVRDYAAGDAPAILIGRVAGSGAADDAHDNRFLAIEGVDGKQWHVGVEQGGRLTPPDGAVVEIRRASGIARKSDLVIAAIAERHRGVYSDALHQEADPRATPEYRLAHKRRLEAMRRAGIVEREKDGSWLVPDDYLNRAAEFEAGKGAASVRVLSFVTLEHLHEAAGGTFLDDALEGRDKIDAGDSGFGAALKNALAARRRWLLANGFAEEEGGALRIDRRALHSMARDAVAQEGARLEARLGKSFIEPVEGERVSGVYRRPVDLASGRYALVERSKEFALLPWREALEARRGMEISAVLRRSGIAWEIGKERGLGR